MYIYIYLYILNGLSFVVGAAVDSRSHRFILRPSRKEHFLMYRKRVEQ